MNAYEQLGVSSSASSADVRRAYRCVAGFFLHSLSPSPPHPSPLTPSPPSPDRKRALQLHPDKNPDDPAAAAAFTELQRAYALLCDDEARAALDAWLEVERQKEERGKMRSEKRRKMAEDLEARERRADDVQPREAEVKLRLQRQLDRLKRQAEERQWQAMQVRRSRREDSAAVPVDEGGADDDEYLKPSDVRLFPAGAASAASAASVARGRVAPAAAGETEMRIIGAMREMT
jgi:curved DNA-binding protein CbpA